MSIRAGVVVAVTFQQVDDTPNTEASAEGDNKGLKNGDTEIHRRYPEYTIMTLEHATWVEWTGENNKEKKEISHG